MLPFIKFLIFFFLFLIIYLIILEYLKTKKCENFMAVIGPVYKPVNKSINQSTSTPVNTYYRNFKYYIDIDGLAVDTYKNF